jgi:iron complex transport system substrate-binding protein
MKRKPLLLIICMLLIFMITAVSGCREQDKQAQEVSSRRAIEDMAGRSVTVPDEIDKVFCTSATGTVVMYSLCPEKMVGWNYDLSDIEKKYILSEYKELPNLGGWFGKNTGNIEEILKINPDVIISLGVITDSEKSTADRIQQQLGMPVVLVDGELTNIDRAYEFLGELLGVESKAQQLADYCRQTMQEIKAAAEQIPEEKRVRVYYAEGPKGLQTDPQHSIHTQVLDLVGGVNVADVSIDVGQGMADVSLEQVMAWDPELIICWHDVRGGCYSEIINNKKWSEIKAVKDNQVYQIPHGPFSWFDRPWSVNRVLGLKWTAELLYPEYFQYDIKKETKEFYEKFYHYQLTDEEVDELLKGAVSPSMD